MSYGQVLTDLITTSDGVSSAGLYGFKNRLINSDMRIDQRNAGASVTPANTDYTLDRWKVGASAASKFSVQQNSGSVTPPSGFINYLGCVSLSAYTVGSGESFFIRQQIEGLNTADLAWGTASAATVTLSFWVRSSLTGTFGGGLKNSDATRSYPFTYTISSANTWEQKSVTVAGDTSGTWLTTNGTGISLTFGLGVGSTASGTAGAWASANYNSATGATSVVGTSGATFYITGVQLEKGSTATSFDYRPYGTELSLCQRYYYRVQALGAGTKLTETGYAVSTTQTFMKNPFQVRMRSAPSALEQSGTAADYVVERCGAGTFVTCSAVPVINSASTWSGETAFTVASGLVNSNAGSVYGANTNAYLAWSAEL